MRIREFAPSDDASARALWEAAEHVSAPPPDEVARVHAHEPRLFLVAEDGERLLGVVMGTFDGRRGWIFRLAVDPAHRHRGVGAALIGELERRFVAMGVTRIRLLTLADNDGAQRFWGRLGYERFDDIVMFSKDIDAASGDAC